ncbi:MAG: hypothetical protein V3T58_04430 [Candidatus Hydrothermarchaeales archaeon]
MTYYVNALEYLGRDVTIKGKTMKGVEAKRFVTLKKSDSLPSKDEVVSLAKSNPKVKKVWVMEMQGNKWRKAMDVVNV